MREAEITKAETLSDGKYKLELYHITDESGAESKTLKREVYRRPEAATILLIDPARKTVLLTRQFRLPIHLKGIQEHLIEACAGIIDEGELPEAAIVREVEEETGYRISEIEQIAQGFSIPASVTEYVYFFIGKYSPEMKVTEGGGLADEGERIEVLELPAAEAKELLSSGKLKDVKTILLLQHALIHNLI